jgi:transposase-like protein
MPWKGVTVSEQRQRFLEEYLLNYYPVSGLAERFHISRTTAHKWIRHYKQRGQIITAVYRRFIGGNDIIYIWSISLS